MIRRTMEGRDVEDPIPIDTKMFAGRIVKRIYAGVATIFFWILMVFILATTTVWFELFKDRGLNALVKVLEYTFTNYFLVVYMIPTILATILGYKLWGWINNEYE